MLVEGMKRFNVLSQREVPEREVTACKATVWMRAQYLEALIY